MSISSFEHRPIDLIIPFYRNVELVSPLFRSLQQPAVLEELARVDVSIIAINDSPEDTELAEGLQRALECFGSQVPCDLVKNERNLGFVQAVNRALRMTVERKHHALLLNSDTVVFPGAFAEMCEVANLDPMIGFVSPRSNNATICSLPHQEQHKPTSPEEGYRLFLELSKHLPRFHFVPVGVGFCLLVRFDMLMEFGLFDESFGGGYNEENDLMMRANRCGYRAAIANRAFIYHIGEASFSNSSSPKQLRQERNAAILDERYPEYTPSVERYLNSAHFQAELLMTGLIPDARGKLDLVFDLSSLGLYHNGSFLASKKILEAAPRLWPQFNLYVMASQPAWEFHALDRIEGLSLVSVHTPKQFAVAFRFAQPFSFEQMHRMSRLAPVNVYGMFDPIAFDCLYLNSKTPDDLETLWITVFEHADGVIYISDFVADLFRRRFGARPGLRELVVYPSLDLQDYRAGVPLNGASPQHILVIGNRFAHKRVPATVAALSQAFPEQKIAAVGVREECGSNVVTFDSGNLDESAMHDLLERASLVVFPSTYEGFGFPVLEGLARHKPVLARSIPVLREIRERIGASENLIFYSSTDELIERLKQGFPAWRDGTMNGNGAPHDWNAAALRMGSFISESVSAVDFERVLVPRIRQIQLLGQHSERTGGPALSLRGSEEVAIALQEREKQIQDIHASWSWRLTSPMRRLASVCLQIARRDKLSGK
jgi:GT2 family glycosyltransferase/glycosyltransferase involved in cell wall biosynthesis